MSDSVIVGLLSLLGTLVGTFGGFYMTNKLVVFRIERLEEAVKENQKTVDRVYRLEESNKIQDTRIDDIEKEQARIIDDIRELKYGN